MERQFDLVVIGTGAAGSAGANYCRSAGWEVAIIDSRPFGGTCALRGCDPKKVLVGAADALDWVKRMNGRGISAAESRISWPELIKFKRTFTDPVPESRRRDFERAGITTFSGVARFVDPSTIEIGGNKLKARYILIASGAKPVPLKIPGHEYVSTSDDFLELDQLPARIVFIGGGYVSFEFAHIAARAGAKASIVHRGPVPLGRFDPDLVGRLLIASHEIGITTEVNAEVQAVERGPNGLRVIAAANGSEKILECDLVVHGAGRVPDIDQLQLENGKVEYSKWAIRLNDFLQSVSNPSVYAAGDAASKRPALTPVAGRDGTIAAENMLKGNHRKPDYRGVPSVVFTVPPLSIVGLQEADVRKQGLNFQINSQDTSTWYSSRRINEKHSAFKVLVEKQTDRILGAHILGTNAEEMINLFALAIQYGLTSTMLKEAWYAYPTHASDLPYMI